MNTNARQLLSDAKFYEAYSRFDSNLDRYETWQESVHRINPQSTARIAV